MVDFGNYMPSQQGIPDWMQAAQGAPQNNFLQQLLASQPELAQAVRPLAAQEPPKAAEAPRKRRSFLDTVGRISDVLARVGGAEALYQPTIDANAARTQQIDLDAMKKQLLEQQVKTGGLNIENEQRSRMALALGAIADAPNAAEMWPQVAQQAGIPEAQAAAIGQELQRNPNAAGMLAKALGLQPQQQGSLPASIQNYAMYQRILAEQGPEAAQQFMRFAQPEMEALKPYQAAQLAQEDREFRRQVAKDRREAGFQAREIKIKEEKAATGGADLTPTQRGVVTQKLATLPVIDRQLRRVEELQAAMQSGGTLARGALGGLLPGAVAGGNAEQFDKALGALRKSILSLTRTPGIGSMSNYETALDEMQLPSRWGSDAGRNEAISGIRELIQGLAAGYREMVPNAGRRPTRPTGGGGGGPKPGTVEGGFRFKGGNPADKANWVKVR